jgi:septum formation protein
MNRRMNMILASSSPRRRELMISAGYEFTVIVPDVEELSYGDPYELVIGNAISKARSIGCEKGDIIIGADTTGICDGKILGKPVDEEDARRMLFLQQNHPCVVITGVAVLDTGKNRMIHGYERSVVVMDGGSEGVEEYLESGLWKGKAGSFGLQDRGPIGARVVEGEEDNVIGMPITLLRRLLSLTGFEYPERTPSGKI